MDHALFARFGLLAVPDFLPAASCAALRADMLASTGEPGQIVSGTGAAVDMDVRRVRSVGVAAAARREVRTRLHDLAPRLERHFAVTLAGFERLQFLVYSAGGFYKQHRDNDDSPHAQDFVKRRAISIVMFLNDETDAPGTACYGGGHLTFYGLLAPPWECGFPLTGVEGLLVAFRPDIEHEVTPVLHGERLTVVTWGY